MSRLGNKAATKRKDQQDSGSNKKVKTSNKMNGQLTSGDERFTWTLLEDSGVCVGQYLGGGQTSPKIAAFDFDGTLSTPKSGAKFPKNGDDFQLTNTKWPDVFKSYSSSGYRIVIFSNQLGVTLGSAKIGDVISRFEGILKTISLDIPVLVLFCINQNWYRKPRPGMFELFQEKYNDGIQVDLTRSVYVGDAAGRLKSSTQAKDHSDADYLFSLNVGIPFLTPEQFLNCEMNQINQISGKNARVLPSPDFNPRLINWDEPYMTLHNHQEFKDRQEYLAYFKSECLSQKEPVVVIFVGIPASGKSRFYDLNLKDLNFQVVSQDVLKSNEKCQKELKRILSEKKPSTRIVVDNTNPDTKSRKVWIDICKNYNAYLVAVHFVLSAVHALHNNTYRRLTSSSQTKGSVPTFVIKNQEKNQPEFSDANHQKMYQNFL